MNRHLYTIHTLGSCSLFNYNIFRSAPSNYLFMSYLFEVCNILRSQNQIQWKYFVILSVHLESRYIKSRYFAKCVPPNVCRQIWATKCDPPNVSRQMRATKCVPPNVSHQMWATKCVPPNMCRQMWVIKCVPPNVSHQMWAIKCVPPAKCEPSNVCHQMCSTKCVPPNVSHQIMCATRCEPPNVCHPSRKIWAGQTSLGRVLPRPLCWKLVTALMRATLLYSQLQL